MQIFGDTFGSTMVVRGALHKYLLYCLAKADNVVLGTTRNPSLKYELFRIAILSFALTEANALFALMIVFLNLFAL